MVWERIWFDCEELHCVQPHTTSASQGWRAQASACSHQRCSQMRNSGAFVYPNGHRSQESSLSTKKAVSGIFPHGYGCVWLHSAEVVWEDAQPGVSSLTIAQCTLQTMPAWPCPPNTTIPWVLPQVMLATSLKKLPTWAMSWIIVNSDIHQTQQIITFTETFPFYWSSTLQLSKVTAASGGRWEMCLLEMLVLSNSPVV